MWYPSIFGLSVCRL